jgi:hypothetical protein
MTGQQRLQIDGFRLVKVELLKEEQRIHFQFQRGVIALQIFRI